MKFKNYFKYLALVPLLIAVALNSTFGQTQNFPSPRENKLLNGARLLVWNDSKAPNVTVKIRIHSGSSFDPLGKEGVMQLLADILFPTDSTKEFFTEDLNGSFSIDANYDYIQINASGDADKLLTILETLAPALTNPQINKETAEKVRAALLARVQTLEKNPVFVADQAVARRLLGAFPYGRPQLGTSETLAKIDFADLLLAYQKFFTADNATIAISGSVNPDFALRATKRLFGGWLKSDKRVPSTFAQPDVPKAELQILEAAGAKTSELRFAIRGMARSDKDFFALRVLREILQERVQKQAGTDSLVIQSPNVLPGFIIFRISKWNVGGLKKEGDKIVLPDEIKAFPSSFLKDPVKPEEVDRARKELESKLQVYNLADYWLDAQTYNLVSVKDDWQKFQSVAPADVQRVLERLQKEAVASVLVVSPEQPNNNSATSNP